MPSQKFVFEVAPELQGLRLDKFLSHFEQIKTRSRAHHLIENACVFVNGKPAKASLEVKVHDRVEVALPEPTSTDLVPMNFALDILYEDADLIVVNKPAGLVVHPAAGHAQDTLVNALMNHTKDLSMKFGEDRPGIVHRIDKDTSGLLVVAKNDFAHESLAAQFKNKAASREYVAIACGFPRIRAGKIQSYLLRHPMDRKRYASLTGADRSIITHKLEPPPAHGKWSVTNFEIIKSKESLHLLKLKLETGRTHQIRVHLSEFGLPIVGDVLYGFERKLKNLSSSRLQSQLKHLSRFFLHATQLGFTHPRTNEPMSFKVDWPQADLALIRTWGLSED